ncbi:MAG: hypothetical protein IMY73_03240 [Bacteroidetes bacterium]|nr:hypothetical protein [Bacteroidota bacterium]
MVRTIFMPNTNKFLPANNKLYGLLLEDELRQKVAFRISQAYIYLECKSFKFNNYSYCGEDMVILSEITSYEKITEFIDYLRCYSVKNNKRIVVVIKDIYDNKRNSSWWKQFDALKLDLYWAGIIIFDNNLNIQSFKLRL